MIPLRLRTEKYSTKPILMESGWTKVYSCLFEHQVSMMKSLLLNKDIPSIIRNTRDSMNLHLNTLDQIELYVQNEKVILAKYIINSAGGE